jgi:DNA-binding CsgD family transcriptional regulator
MKSPYHCLLTPEGAVLYCNRAGLALRDLKMQDVAGKLLWETPWLIGQPDEVIEGHKQMVEIVARTGIPEQRRFEIVFPEDVRAFDVLMSPVWTSDGTILAITSEGIEANHILNGREKEVLEWAAKGKTSWEIAMIVGISQRTVEFHANRAREKLKATNTIEAVSKAIKSGLLGVVTFLFIWAE